MVFIRIISAHYYYFIACNTPYLGENINCAPKSRLNDGFSDLIKIKNTAGKYNLLKQLFNQDTGDYFNASGEIPFYTGLEYVKTKCWRLIPKVNIDQDDNVREQRHLPRHYSIDGERYNIEPIQVKTLSKALKVFYFDMSKY
jgi:diacylglycerol kinase family enzyme